MNEKNKKILGVSVVIAALLAAGILIAYMVTKEEAYRLIQVVEVAGEVEMDRANIGKSQLQKDTNLQNGDKVSVMEEAYTRMALDEDKYVYAEENTRFELEAEGDSVDSKTKILLTQGAITTEIQKPLTDHSSFEVTTPNSTMAVRGTVYRVSLEYDENGESYTKLEVFEGQVATKLVRPDGTVSDKEVMVSAGKGILAHGDEKESEYILQDGTKVKEDQLRETGAEEQLLFDVDIAELPEQALKSLITISENQEKELPYTKTELKEALQIVEEKKILEEENSSKLEEKSKDEAKEEKGKETPKEDRTVAAAEQPREESMEPVANPGADSDVRPDVDLGSDTDVNSDLDSKPSTDGDADLDSKPDTDGGSEAEPDSKLDTDGDSDSDLDSKPDTDSDADSDSDSEVKPDTDSDADSDSDSEVKPDTDGDADSGSKPGTDGDADSDSNSKPDTDGDSESKPDSDEKPDHGKVAYKIVHKFENPQGAEYHYTANDSYTDSYEGLPGEYTIAPRPLQNLPAGYTYDAVRSETKPEVIAKDGTTVLELCYTLNRYTVTWVNDNKTGASTVGHQTTDTFRHGEKLGNENKLQKAQTDAEANRFIEGCQSVWLVNEEWNPQERVYTTEDVVTRDMTLHETVLIPYTVELYYMNVVYNNNIPQISYDRQNVTFSGMRPTGEYTLQEAELAARPEAEYFTPEEKDTVGNARVWTQTIHPKQKTTYQIYFSRAVIALRYHYLDGSIVIPQSFFLYNTPIIDDPGDGNWYLKTPDGQKGEKVIFGQTLAKGVKDDKGVYYMDMWEYKE